MCPNITVIIRREKVEIRRRDVLETGLPNPTNNTQWEVETKKKTEGRVVTRAHDSVRVRIRRRRRYQESRTWGTLFLSLTANPPSIPWIFVYVFSFYTELIYKDKNIILSLSFRIPIPSTIFSCSNRKLYLCFPVVDHRSHLILLSP